MSFSRLDVAAEVRDLMFEVGKKAVQSQSPTESYGRVISVNSSALTATVWFPGDEAPVSVNLFPNTIPGQWHERFGLGSGAGITNTSYFGYGSQVAVRSFEGKQFIVQILTGGVLAADAKMFNASIVSQEATEVAADQAGHPVQVIGEPYETFINCHISNDTLPDGGAISFGPFTTGNSELPGVGWIEITVTEASGASKHYKLPINALRDFEHTGGNGFLDAWFRVIAEQSITDNAGQIIDFDLDMAIKRTVYGNADEFFPDNELWMRVVKRGAAWTGLNAKITIRATNIQSGRSLSGRKLFMQESLISPPEIKGYVGFHNAQMIFRDFDDYGTLDNYGRTITSGGWGTSDSGPTYQVRNGSTANFGVDGQAAWISNPTNSLVGLVTIQQSNIMNTDVYFDVWTPVMPTGAEIQTGHVTRWTDMNNFYWFKVVFQTSGQITLSIAKTVAGSSSVLGSDYNPPGVTFTANERIRARARIVTLSSGTVWALLIKAWKPATQREPDWQKIETDASLGASAGNFTGFFSMPGGSNSNTKPFKIYFDNVKASLYVKGQDNSGAQWHTGPWRSGLLRVAQSLQQTWMATGQVIWNGSRIRWTNRIYFGGIGQHRNALAAGSTMMQTPPSGFTVPVVPNGGTVSVDGSGIPLTAGQALYVGVPPGQTWENLYEYLFIVDNTIALNYDLPEWAILIAMRSDTDTSGPTLRLGDGRYLDQWRPITPLNGWVEAGYPHATGAYRMVGSPPNSLQLRGVWTPGTKTDGTTLFQLAQEYYPASHITVPLSSAPPTLGAFTPMLQCEVTGDCKLYGLVAGTGIIYLNQTIPLDTY